MQDQLTSCRKCGSPLCYERHAEGIIFWDCIQCGFSTNTLLLENTEAVLTYEAMMPSLFKAEANSAVIKLAAALA